MSSNRFAVVGVATGLLLGGVAAAQTGNLVANPHFDLAVGVGGWQVLNPEFNSLAPDGSLDFDACVASGVALGSANPPTDNGTGQYTVCLGAISTAESYRMSGEFRYESSAVSGRAFLSLSFFTGPNCTGTNTNGLFAGYATHDVAGWQHLAAGPVTPDPAAQSAYLTVGLTQVIGSQPAVSVQFDEIRVTPAGWVFADDLDIGESCRWSAATP